MITLQNVLSCLPSVHVPRCDLRTVKTGKLCNAESVSKIGGLRRSSLLEKSYDLERYSGVVAEKDIVTPSSVDDNKEGGVCILSVCR